MYANDLKKSIEMQIPEDVLERLSNSEITLTFFEEKNAILKDTNLQREVGFGRFSDGSYLVSMTCPMPGITPEMIAWWFWWHPQAVKRYQMWFPGEHYSVSYDKHNKDYFAQSSLPTFQPNTQYPVERIGSIKMPLRIDFVSPEEFGFSKQAMKENNKPKLPEDITQSLFECQRDGLTIRGTEYRPAGEDLPVAVVCHGFMANQKTVVQYAKELARLGYCAYTFDFCGGSVLKMGKSDGKTTEMSVLTEVKDLEAVIAYVRSLPLHRERTAAYGMQPGRLRVCYYCGKASRAGKQAGAVLSGTVHPGRCPRRQDDVCQV